MGCLCERGDVGAGGYPERMVDPALLEQAKGLPVAERWELANELWESLEDEDFPIGPGVAGVLRERRAEYADLPLAGPTLAEIIASWRQEQH